MSDNHDMGFDDAIRSVLANPDVDLRSAERASDRRVRREMRDRIARAQTPLSGRDWFMRKRLPPIVAAGLAISVAVAFAPSFMSDHGDAGSIHSLPPTANAREALAWAGSALDQTLSEGSGDVWHAVLRQHRDGELVGIQDLWYSQDTDSRAEFATNVSKQQAWASLDAFDGDIERIRAYEHINDVWRVPVISKPMPWSFQWDVPGGRPPSGQPLGGPPPRMWDRNGKELNAADQDLAKHPKRRVSATVSTNEAIHRWVRTASGARSGTELGRATYLFLRTTRGEFLNDIRDRNHAAIRATTVRQLVRLMSVARLTPVATRAIYAEFAQLGNLQRLDDVAIDGRTAVRIQFETGDISNTELEIADPNSGAQRLQLDETVLVIDLQSGALLRTESLDRKRWTEYEHPERVMRVGDDPASCDKPPVNAPCDLLRDRGPLAEEARQFARENADKSSRNAVNGPYDSRPWLGHLDQDGLPLDDYDDPIDRPSTPAEAERLGVDFTSCSGRTGGPKADPRILYPDPNRYCDPLYPLAELSD